MIVVSLKLKFITSIVNFFKTEIYNTIRQKDTRHHNQYRWQDQHTQFHHFSMLSVQRFNSKWIAAVECRNFLARKSFNSMGHKKLGEKTKPRHRSERELEQFQKLVGSVTVTHTAQKKYVPYIIYQWDVIIIWIVLYYCWYFLYIRKVLITYKICIILALILGFISSL